MKVLEQSQPHFYWATVFLEPSTRTRLSFEIAIHEAGCKILTLDPDQSSLKKDESLLDTFLNLQAMGVHGAVVRTTDHDSLLGATTQTSLRVLNAGSGIHEHPTQALLDAVTLMQRFGAVQGLRIGYVGDVAHSRVARSGRDLFRRLGAQVLAAGPDDFVSSDWKECRVDTDELYSTCDAVIALRVQKERHIDGIQAAADFLETFGVSIRRLEQMKSSAVVLHPGPCNRGIEIDSAVVSHPRCLMFQQVQNGVRVRTQLIQQFSNSLEVQK